jgi:hypothetical protein
LHLRPPRNPKFGKAVTQEHQRTTSLDGDFHPQAIYIQVLKGWFGHEELLSGQNGKNSLNFWFLELASNVDVRAKQDVRTPSERVYTEAAIV